MWILRQIVKIGTNQLKNYTTLSQYGIRKRTGIALIQQNLLCTQAAKHHREKSSTTTLDKPAMNHKIKLNSVNEDVPYLLTKDQQDLITRGSAENENKLYELLVQLQTLRETGKGLPETIRIEDIDNMVGLSHSKLCRYLDYLLITQYKAQKGAQEKAAKLILNEQKRQERLERESTLEHPWLERSNIFMPLHKSLINTVYNTNAVSGMLYGQKVIIDCSYNSYMDDYCLKLTAKQILFCLYSSRTNRRPMSLHICNLDYESKLMYYLEKLNPAIRLDIPISMHSESYLELFDRKKLVYLTPHTQVAVEYDPEDIYILGGFVDKAQMELSRSKADKEKLRYATLPLNRYLNWKNGTKNLCIHHCFNILLDVKNTGDWAKALQKHVPTRKTKTISQENC